MAGGAGDGVRPAGGARAGAWRGGDADRARRGPRGGSGGRSRAVRFRQGVAAADLSPRGAAGSARDAEGRRAVEEHDARGNEPAAAEGVGGGEEARRKGAGQGAEGAWRVGGRGAAPTGRYWTRSSRCRRPSRCASWKRCPRAACANSTNAGRGGRMTEGCDKSVATCAGRFANVANFRGEPYLPGIDLLTRYPGA
nr:phage BR0599 family protein [Sphingomonas sp. SUN019]